MTMPVQASLKLARQPQPQRQRRLHFSSHLQQYAIQTMVSAFRLLANFASAFFLCSGIWGDLLLIRVFLTCAYACLVG